MTAKPQIYKVFALIDYKGNIEPYNGGLAVFSDKQEAELTRLFYKTTRPKVITCAICRMEDKK
jgi:hypothetical protein